MTEITKYQLCVEDQEQYIIEAIGVLQASGEMDLRILQGACYGCHRITKDLIAEAQEDLNIPELAIPHVNWDALIIDWLASIDSVAVQTSEGTVLIERSDCDVELLEILKDMKADGEI